MAIAINSARGPCTPDIVKVSISSCHQLYVILTPAPSILGSIVLGYLYWALSDCSHLPRDDDVPVVHQ